MSTSRFAAFRGRSFFSLANIVVAALTVMAVFRGLPLRHWLIDGSTILAAVGFGLGTIGLWVPKSARRLASLGLTIVSVLGLLTLVGLVTGLGTLEGIHGPLAAGSRLILVLVGAMVVPYLIVLPGVELSWIKAQDESDKPEPLPAPKKPEPAKVDTSEET